MRIVEIVKDIFTDVDITNQKHARERRENGHFPLTPRQRAAENTEGWFMIFLPQLLGFIFGLAVTRLFGMTGSAYFVIGGLFALIVGTLKSVKFDKIEFTAAVIRNIILMLMFCGAFALVRALA